MCGRFVSSKTRLQLQSEFHLAPPAEWKPRYNVAPSQAVLVMRLSSFGKKELALHRWGLLPAWATGKNSIINIRAETVAEKPSFCTAFMRRRCVVIADGFYEWMRRTSAKGPAMPVYFQFARPLGFAGLWDEAAGGTAGERVERCAIITVAANELVAPIHDRMPALLDAQAQTSWLDADADKQTLRALLEPAQASFVRPFEVSPAVNNPANDDRSLLAEVLEESSIFERVRQ